MTTSYQTDTTITETHIIMKSIIGNMQKTSVIARGSNEDTELRDAAVAHKQLADSTLATDTPARIEQRRQNTLAEAG